MEKKKLLKEILKEVEIEEVCGDLEVLISGISENSKKIEPGYLFIARKGTRFDGKAFIDEAIQKGAAAVLRDSPCEKKFEGEITQIYVKDLKKFLPKIVFSFFEHPQKKLKFIGITGTNGKTSVAFFTLQLLRALKIRTACLGTIFYDLEDEVIEAKETTPSLIDLAYLFDKMVKKGITHCVMEVSSHALDQGRVSGIPFDVGVFTNLSRDHLDYHKDMESYFQAKARLFTEHLKKGASGVVSLESFYGTKLLNLLKEKRPDLRIIKTNNGDVRVKIKEISLKGMKVSIEIGEKSFEVNMKHIFAEFQGVNLGTVCGIIKALGIPEEKWIKHFGILKPPSGRFEPVRRKKESLVVVDYAHTPDALKKALISARHIAKNKVILVFGCGGNRDVEKRPQMGEIAEQFADVVILTSDNPRYEEPMKIIEDIKKGFKFKEPVVIEDRRKAISFGWSVLNSGDVLLIAGKGHENYQEIKGQRIPFSDKEEVLRL